MDKNQADLRLLTQSFVALFVLSLVLGFMFPDFILRTFGVGGTILGVLFLMTLTALPQTFFLVVVCERKFYPSKLRSEGPVWKQFLRWFFGNSGGLPVLKTTTYLRDEDPPKKVEPLVIPEGANYHAAEGTTIPVRDIDKNKER